LSEDETRTGDVGQAPPWIPVVGRIEDVIVGFIFFGGLGIKSSCLDKLVGDGVLEFYESALSKFADSVLALFRRLLLIESVELILL